MISRVVVVAALALLPMHGLAQERPDEGSMFGEEPVDAGVASPAAEAPEAGRPDEGDLFGGPTDAPLSSPVPASQAP